MQLLSALGGLGEAGQGGGWRGYSMLHEEDVYGGAGGAGGSYKEYLLISDGVSPYTFDVTIGQGGAGGAGEPAVAESAYIHDSHQYQAGNAGTDGERYSNY